MISLKEINTAIVTTLQDALTVSDYNEVPIVSSDFTDGIQRPSIRIVLDSGKTQKFNSQLKERNLTIRLYFYAKDKNNYKLDNLYMQEIFENAFLEDIKVTDNFYLPYDEDNGFESEIVDTVLCSNFTVQSLETIYDDSALEYMEDLDITLNAQED